MDFLQAGPPALTLGRTCRPHNTRNPKYGAGDITDVRVWANFNLARILAEYRPLLNATRIQRDPMPASQPEPIITETSVRQRFALYLHPRVRRALRHGFEQLHRQQNLPPGRHTEVSLAEGNQARTPGTYTPDVAYFSTNLRPTNRPNRATGDIKPSYNWDTRFQKGLHNEPLEFKQALSQVNWYMRQQNTRYGFILTDRELVAIRRRDVHGSLELSESIPWATTHGTAANPRLTVMLGLWYLGMLASDNQGWGLPGY